MALTLSEREEISRGLVAGRSIRSIAASLGRAASTVSRDVQRNGGPQCYQATPADQTAWDRARRPKTCKLMRNRALARLVALKLMQFWSPEQIAEWLKHTYPDDQNNPVSHEKIYRSLFIQARGAPKNMTFGRCADFRIRDRLGAFSATGWCDQPGPAVV
jgi:IS30 family transposase